MKDVVKYVSPLQTQNELKKLIQANPIPVRLALEVQPNVRDARHVCQMIQQIDQETRNQEIAQNIAMVVPGFEWFAGASDVMRVVGLIARTYMLTSSAQTRQNANDLIQKINQGMLSREIPATQGNLTIRTIQQQRPTLLGLAVQAALTVGGFANVGRMMQAESRIANLGRVEGGSTQAEFNKVYNPSTTPPRTEILWNKEGTGTLQQSNEGNIPAGNSGSGFTPNGPKGSGGGGLGTVERVAPKVQVGNKLEVTPQGKLAAQTKDLSFQNNANIATPNAQVSNLPFPYDCIKLDHQYCWKKT